MSDPLSTSERTELLDYYGDRSDSEARTICRLLVTLAAVEKERDEWRKTVEALENPKVRATLLEEPDDFDKDDEVFADALGRYRVVPDPECIAKFGISSAYDPACCRFPKSCSPTMREYLSDDGDQS